MNQMNANTIRVRMDFFFKMLDGTNITHIRVEDEERVFCVRNGIKLR